MSRVKTGTESESESEIVTVTKVDTETNDKTIDHEALKKRRIEKERQDEVKEDLAIKKRMEIAERFVATYGGLPSFAKPVGNGNWDIETPELAEREMAKYRLRAKIRQGNFARLKESSKDTLVDTVYDKMEAKEEEYEEQQKKEKAKKDKVRNKKVRQKRNKRLVKQMEDNIQAKTETNEVNETNGNNESISVDSNSE